MGSRELSTWGTAVPYKRLTLAQAAKYLHLTAKEVERLAGHGVLPCQRVGSEWLCTKESLDDWLAENMHELAESHLHRIKATDLAQATEEGRLRLAGDLLTEEGIELELDARTAPATLRRLCEAAERTGYVYDAPALLEALREREKLCSTALPGGFALPHPRTRIPYMLGKSLVVFARTVQPIPFGGPHGEKTDLFFLLLALDDAAHLQLLARLNLILRDEAVRHGLREAETAREALEVLASREDEVQLKAER